jgi:GH35 family endo-1,4-beta-xylanase
VETQRRYYYDIVSACVHNTHCDAIYFWGISDRDSWINNPQYGFTLAGMPDTPLLWNASYQRKAAYCAVREAILGHAYSSNASCM